MICTCTINIKEQPNCKQYDGPSKDLIDSLEEAVLPFTLVGEDYGDTHDPDEPGEHEVSHHKTIPLAVVKEPIATTTIVDKELSPRRSCIIWGWGLGRRERSNGHEKGEKRERIDFNEHVTT